MKPWAVSPNAFVRSTAHTRSIDPSQKPTDIIISMLLSDCAFYKIATAPFKLLEIALGAGCIYFSAINASQKAVAVASFGKL